MIQTLSYFCLEASSFLHVGSFGQRISNGGNPGGYFKRSENTLELYATFYEYIHFLGRGFMAVNQNLKEI